MVFPITGFIHTSFAWASFLVGAPLNLILIQLIVRHTPKSMQIYSKILLQTCITDLILLLATILIKTSAYAAPEGFTGFVLTGLVQIRGVENRGWALACWLIYVFLVYVSMFGYVAQFIYRYLALNWDKHLSPCAYFSLFGFTLLFPFTYCLMMAPAYYPPIEHAFITDQSAAALIGLDITNDQPIHAGVSSTSWISTLSLYYTITFLTVGYTLICIFGWLMHSFLRDRSKMGASSQLTDKMIEMNKQITRNLIIQAALPLPQYLFLLFFLCTLLFRIDISKWYWVQYDLMLSSILFWLPCAINPIVTIYIVQYYHKVFVGRLIVLVKSFRTMRSAETSQQQNDQHNINRWAQPTSQANLA